MLLLLLILVLVLELRSRGALQPQHSCMLRAVGAPCKAGFLSYSVLGLHTTTGCKKC